MKIEKGRLRRMVEDRKGDSEGEIGRKGKGWRAETRETERREKRKGRRKRRLETGRNREEEKRREG